MCIPRGYTIRFLLVTLVAFNILSSKLIFADVDVKYVVIVHPSNVNVLSKKDIARIFLDKRNTFPDGKEAIPISYTAYTPISIRFADTFLSKSSSEAKAYWARLLFTGRGTPPREVEAIDEIKKIVSGSPNHIGYIDSASVDESVKVISDF